MNGHRLITLPLLMAQPLAKNFFRCLQPKTIFQKRNFYTTVQCYHCVNRQKTNTISILILKKYLQEPPTPWVRLCFSVNSLNRFLTFNYKNAINILYSTLNLITSVLKIKQLIFIRKNIFRCNNFQNNKKS